LINLIQYPLPYHFYAPPHETRSACRAIAPSNTFDRMMQETTEKDGCAKYELPAANLENLYTIFSSIQKALIRGDTETVQQLCVAGQQQLHDVVICFD